MEQNSEITSSSSINETKHYFRYGMIANSLCGTYAECDVEVFFAPDEKLGDNNAFSFSVVASILSSSYAKASLCSAPVA